MISRAIRFGVPVAAIGYGLRLNTFVVHTDGVQNSKIKRIWSIYEEPAPLQAKALSSPEDKDKDSALAKGVAKARNEIEPAKKSIRDLFKESVDLVADSTSYILNQIHYTQHEAPIEVKYATIAGGGILGLFAGLRRGKIGKLYTMALGSGAGFAICFPEDAKVYASKGYAHAKHYGAVAYNFVIGIKPGEE